MQKDSKRLDLTGQRYGRWLVLSEALQRGDNRFWNCRCDCGTEKPVQMGTLRNGTSISCGCYQAEHVKDWMTTHGHSPAGLGRTGEYNSYWTMRQRCTNPKNTNYHRYGGRGIKVCQRWLGSFPDFLTDMGPQPTPQHSLDRYPNRDGNYEPGNCRWASQSEQMNNTRRCRFVTIDGRTQSLSQWARELGRHPKTVHERVRTGWDEIEALTTPTAADNGGWSLRRKRHN